MIPLNEEYLMLKIYIIRGVQVMLDFDLAAIYGYETRFFTRQVNNNKERFKQDFRFQLTKDEFKNLMCKNFTSRWGGTRKNALRIHRGWHLYAYDGIKRRSRC